MSRPVTHVTIASIWIDVVLREQHGSSAQVTRHPVEDGAQIADHVVIEGDQLQLEGVVTNTPIEQPGSHADGAIAIDSGTRMDVVELMPTGIHTELIEGEPSLGMLGLVPLADQTASLLGDVGLDIRNPRQFTMVTPELEPRTWSRQLTALTFSREFDRVAAVDKALREAFRARKPVQVKTALRIYEAMIITDLSINVDGSTGDALRFGCTVEEIRIVKSVTGLAGAPDPVNARAKPAVSTGNQNTVAEDPPAKAQDRVSAATQLIDAGKRILSSLGGGL